MGNRKTVPEDIPLFRNYNGIDQRNGVQAAVRFTCARCGAEYYESYEDILRDGRDGEWNIQSIQPKSPWTRTYGPILCGKCTEDFEYFWNHVVKTNPSS